VLQLETLSAEAHEVLAARETFPPVWKDMAGLERVTDQWITRWLETRRDVARGKGANARTSVSTVRGGVQIQGDLQQRAAVKRVVNVANGARSEAQTNIATVGKNAKIRGDVDQTVAIKSVTTVAPVAGSTARTDIATVRDNANINDSVKQTVIMPKVVNSGGCVSIGSVGPGAGCD